MASRSRPPLYDIMKAQAARGLPPPGGGRRSLRQDDRMGESWLTPGRVIRVPVGWLLLGAALGLILLIGVYLLGHRAGAEAKQAEFKGLIDFPAGVNTPSRDPLNNRSESPAPRENPAAEVSTQLPPEVRAGEKPREISPPTASPLTSGFGPLESDPRVAGWSYFVLAETTPDGSRRLAQFCRDNGLESYVVSGNNTRRRKVIALPGFPSPARLTSREVKSLQNAIHRLGEKWQRHEPGATNLRDTYLQKKGG